MKLKYGLALLIVFFLCGAEAAEVTDCDDPLIEKPVKVRVPGL